MPWPKGMPHTREMIAKRVRTLQANKKRHRRPEMGRWKCSSCGVLKEAGEFHQDKRTPNGLKSQCKACHNRRSIETRDPENTRRLRSESEARRRARKAGAVGNVSAAAMAALEKRWGAICLARGAPDNLTWDHVQPIARGGTHCVTNLQRLCRPCNETKQARYADYRTDEQKVWIIEFRRDA